ncbi:hypothetical protein BKA61DRAFT_80824 [Leptodontidium sp. MPI-SDFR-AT-0119]|nr:hypothetical protein BKA61DRAFT_80824 [Leptodontidium sp. MPI-SDFR-AT-0119]
MLDGFDHREDEEPGDERLSLLGEDTEKGGERLGNGEEEEEFQGRSCSDKSVMSKIDSPETVLRKNGSPTSSPSVEESTTGHAPALVGEGHMETNERQCDYPSCGRLFQKRHDLNRHKKYHFKPFKCPTPSCAARNVAFSLAKDLLRHQRSHSDERHFCPHVGCFAAVGGKFTGFARDDNWRRHLKNQHT